MQPAMQRKIYAMLILLVVCLSLAMTLHCQEDGMVFAAESGIPLSTHHGAPSHTPFCPVAVMASSTFLAIFFLSLWIVTTIRFCHSSGFVCLPFVPPRVLFLHTTPSVRLLT